MYYIPIRFEIIQEHSTVNVRPGIYHKDIHSKFDSLLKHNFSES